MKFVLLAVLTATCFGANQFPAEQFNQARSLYYKGADGDRQAYDQAAALFSTLEKQCPNDPHIKAYYGSLRLVAASHTWALWTKNSLSKEGIQLMDSAVAAAPDNLDIRFVRAVTTYSLPGFFHRKQQSQQDFDYLAAHAAEAARDGKLEPRLAAASLYYHGEFLQEESRTGPAVEAWKQAIHLAPQSRAARESEAALSKVHQKAGA